MATIYGMSILTVVLYGAFLFCIFFGAFLEYRDVNCPNIFSTNCGYGMGAAYVEAKPCTDNKNNNKNKDDSLNVLLDKIKITAKYDINSVYWRRILIAASIVSFLILYMFSGRCPTGIEWVTAFLVTYISFYVMIVTFQYWVAKPALEQLDILLDQVKEKCDDKSKSKK